MASTSKPADRREKPLRQGPLRLVAAAVLLLVLSAHCPASTEGPPGLFALSIEELMDVKITVATGSDESWFQTPAATFVITQDDIRRSGHRTLPELFRMVPGMHVARFNSHNWAISTRGINFSRFANKLLVLIDGRSIYDHTFGGVRWHAQDIPLENIKQIEVIRGPGATLWGANAVNGVINIITKEASETLGGAATVVGGSHDRGFGFVRYGEQVNDRLAYRVWGKYGNYGRHQAVTGEDGIDDWQSLRAGFRLDRKNSEGLHLSIKGEWSGIDQAGADQFAPARRIFEDTVHGAYLQTTLSRKHPDDSGWTLKGYYDYLDYHQTDALADNGSTFLGFGERRHLFNLDFQYTLIPTDSHRLMWGLAYEFIADQIDPLTELQAAGGSIVQIGFDPDSRHLHKLSGFIQDTIALSPAWSLMVGSKLEHNNQTDFEIQPSARLAWTPDHRQTAWAAISRSVRTSVRLEQDLTAFGLRFGSEDFDAEKVWTYELGYRRKVNSRLTLDLATFYSRYEGLGDLAAGEFGNIVDSNSHGLEALLQWQAAANWRLIWAYSYLGIDHEGPNPSTRYDGLDPRHQFNVRSSWDMTDRLELNAALYYVDQVGYDFAPALDAPAYVRLDLGLTWRPTDYLEFSIWGQNLLDSRHPEAVSSNRETNVEIERSVYASVTVTF